MGSISPSNISGKSELKLARNMQMHTDFQHGCNQAAAPRWSEAQTVMLIASWQQLNACHSALCATDARIPTPGHSWGRPHLCFQCWSPQWHVAFMNKAWPAGVGLRPGPGVCGALRGLVLALTCWSPHLRCLLLRPGTSLPHHGCAAGGLKWHAGPDPACWPVCNTCSPLQTHYSLRGQPV